MSLTDDTKINCAGEFMMLSSDSYQMSQAVGALSALLDGGTSVEFIEAFSEALKYCIEQAQEERLRLSSENPDLVDDCLSEILEFSHAYLAKAYEKKVGRA